MNLNIDVFTEDGEIIDRHFHPKIKKVMDKLKLKAFEEFANYTVRQVYDHVGNDKVFYSIVELLSYKGLRMKEE